MQINYCVGTFCRSITTFFRLANISDLSFFGVLLQIKILFTLIYHSRCAQVLVLDGFYCFFFINSPRWIPKNSASINFTTQMLAMHIHLNLRPWIENTVFPHFFKKGNFSSNYIVIKHFAFIIKKSISRKEISRA